MDYNNYMARANKGQHKIPRTYLQSFTDSQGKLWIGDKDFKLYSRKPDEILTEHDYFTIKFPTGGGTLLIETKYLNDIEGAYATIFRDKISKKELVSNEEKAKLSIFVASMMARQPNRRESLKKFFKDGEEQITHLISLPDHIKKRAGSMILHDKTAPTISADEFLRAGKDISSLHSSLIPNAVESSAPIIFNMQWVFMVRPNEANPFITSDNPCIMVNPVAENKFGRGTMGASPGLRQNDVELTLPLSPDITLMIGWQSKTNCQYINIPLELVDEVNRRTRRHAKTIIGSDKTMIERIVQRTKAYYQSK